MRLPLPVHWMLLRDRPFTLIAHWLGELVHTVHCRIAPAHYARCLLNRLERDPNFRAQVRLLRKLTAERARK